LIEFNPVEAIERPELDESLPEIFTTAEVERVLHATEVIYPRLVPAFAIGFFAGLRSAEIEKLDWAAIDPEAKLIILRNIRTFPGQLWNLVTHAPTFFSTTTATSSNLQTRKRIGTSTQNRQRKSFLSVRYLEISA
jgi:hypothetical protein